ncbi:LysM peptidoglycan-binding domain-containing protein [Actinokineospora iranica]|uniref:LysM domain-containing protein n=1 Tax=Actinokineospora iranica TaxID=1271860 RepID=A0A1G6K4X3_9PSEU|nr:LysM peptidoglycan-binding domain-containing protein [Actinokineospora iranica]SDC25973.1 LysM domain-containing protein [Actinokineospora iranica]
MTDYGIDLSHWNTVTDWHAVRGNNITYASIKLTENTDFVDPDAAGHIAGARSAGIVPGGYHFARPGNIPAQVGHFAAHLERHRLLSTPGALAPMLDMEAPELRGQANSFTAEFIDRLRAATGIGRVLVYANLDWFTHVLRPGQWADEDVMLWIARYNGDPGNPGWTHPRLALHQHTSTGTMPGIPGKVDRNATMTGWSLAALTLDGTTPAPGPQPSAPVPAPPPGPGGTYTIQPGDTLTGIAQKFGTSVTALAALNHIPDPNRILAGATLRLPGPTAPPQTRRYQIRPGDTLSGIAARHGTTVAALARLNGISDPNRIYAGNWLTLP